MHYKAFTVFCQCFKGRYIRFSQWGGDPSYGQRRINTYITRHFPCNYSVLRSATYDLVNRGGDPSCEQAPVSHVYVGINLLIAVFLGCFWAQGGFSRRFAAQIHMHMKVCACDPFKKTCFSNSDLLF